MPVEYRYVKDIYLGDKRMELNVVPAFSVNVTPAEAFAPVTMVSLLCTMAMMCSCGSAPGATDAIAVASFGPLHG